MGGSSVVEIYQPSGFIASVYAERLLCDWKPVSYTHLDVYKRQV